MHRIELAFDKGYRVDKNGNVFTKEGKKRTLHLSNKGYYTFGIRGREGKNFTIYVHKLCSFQKFGKDSLEPGIHTRHLDGNSKNNSSFNIAIGTAKDNTMDIDPAVRKRTGQNAANHKRRFSDKEVEEIRQDHLNGKTYNEISKERKICKSQLSYFLSKSAKRVSNY